MDSVVYKTQLRPLTGSLGDNDWPLYLQLVTFVIDPMAFQRLFVRQVGVNFTSQHISYQSHDHYVNFDTTNPTYVIILTIVVPLLRMAGLVADCCALPAAMRYYRKLKNTSAILLVVLFATDLLDSSILAYYGTFYASKKEPVVLQVKNDGTIIGPADVMAFQIAALFLGHFSRWTVALIVFDRYLYICRPGLTQKISMRTHTAVATGTVGLLMLIFAFSDLYMNQHYNQKLKFALMTLVFATTLIAWIRVFVQILLLRCKLPDDYNAIARKKREFDLIFGTKTGQNDDTKAQTEMINEILKNATTDTKLARNNHHEIATDKDAILPFQSQLTETVPNIYDATENDDYDAVAMEHSNGPTVSKLVRGNYDTGMLLVMTFLCLLLQIPGVIVYSFLEHISYNPGTMHEYEHEHETLSTYTSLCTSIYTCIKPVVCVLLSRTFRRGFCCCRSCCSLSCRDNSKDGQKRKSINNDKRKNKNIPSTAIEIDMKDLGNEQINN